MKENSMRKYVKKQKNKTPHNIKRKMCVRELTLDRPQSLSPRCDLQGNRQGIHHCSYPPLFDIFPLHFHRLIHLVHFPYLSSIHYLLVLVVVVGQSIRLLLLHHPQPARSRLRSQKILLPRFHQDSLLSTQSKKEKECETNNCKEKSAYISHIWQNGTLYFKIIRTYDQN